MEGIRRNLGLVLPPHFGMILEWVISHFERGSISFYPIDMNQGRTLEEVEVSKNDQLSCIFPYSTSDHSLV